MRDVDQRADIESYRGGVSVEYAGESCYLLAGGGAGGQSYDVFRSFSAIQDATFALSSFDGTSQFGYLEVGTVTGCYGAVCMPYLGFHATRVELDPIVESGDVDFRLSNAGGAGDSARGVLGVGVEKSSGIATTRLRFGWMHEFQDAHQTFVSSVANPTVTSLITDRGVDLGLDWGFLRLQCDLFRILGGQASIAYQGQANSHSSFNALFGGIQWVR